MANNGIRKDKDLRHHVEPPPLGQTKLTMQLIILNFSFSDDLSSILGLVIIMTLITIAVTVGIVVFCYNDAACRELWATMTQS